MKDSRALGPLLRSLAAADAPFMSLTVSLFALVMVARLRFRVMGPKSSLSVMIPAHLQQAFSKQMK